MTELSSSGEIKRERCKSCPWYNDNGHSQRWKKYAKKMQSVGLTDGTHRCHELDHKVWDKPNSHNVCIGSLCQK